MEQEEERQFWLTLAEAQARVERTGGPLYVCWSQNREWVIADLETSLIDHEAGPLTVEFAVWPPRHFLSLANIRKASVCRAGHLGGGMYCEICDATSSEQARRAGGPGA